MWKVRPLEPRTTVGGPTTHRTHGRRPTGPSGRPTSNCSGTQVIGPKRTGISTVVYTLSTTSLTRQISKFFGYSVSTRVDEGEGEVREIGRRFGSMNNTEERYRD